MATHAIILETILPIAPRSESKRFIRISTNSRMSPIWRNDNHIAGLSIHGKTTTGIIFGIFLHVNNSLSCPYFVNLRSRPTAIFRNPMDMTLTANRLFTQSTGSIGHDPIKQMHPFEHFSVFTFPHVHSYGINDFRAIALRVG